MLEIAKIQKVYAQFVTRHIGLVWEVSCHINYICWHIPYHAAYDTTHKYKTTHLVVESVDMPGMLSYILSAFEMLNSIL